MLKPHTDRRYERELRGLRDDLLKMAGTVEAMIVDAILSLAARDTVLAAATIRRDTQVNALELSIDNACMVILACRQPMASDLRFVMTASKMVTDLERIGDLAVNICERTVDLAAMPELPRPMINIPRMAQIVRGMVRDAIDAFVTGDVISARAVLARDDEIDQLYNVVFRDLLETMQSRPGFLHHGIHMQSVAKWLERMADHATNLAEQVIFMVEGQEIRHEGKRDRDWSP